MLLTNPLLLCLLSSVALALPTTNQNATDAKPNLEKRNRKSWLGPFTAQPCSGPPGPGEMQGLTEGTCYNLALASAPFIGINYGSGEPKTSAIRFFEDGQCKKSNGAADYVHQDVSGTGMSCINQHQNAGSFKIFWDPEWNNQFYTPNGS